MEDTEYQEPPPPSASTVARRALILATVSCRGFIDNDKANASGASSLAKKAKDWLFALGLDEELSDWERKILSTEFGQLQERDRINASWLAEGLVILAWALRRVSLPAFDVQCDPSATANVLGFLQPESETVLAKTSLRPLAELNEYNEFILNVHWRIRDFSLNHRTFDFESLAKKAWGEPVLRFGLKLSEKDIQIGGQPLSKAPENIWRGLTSITQERHRASNWLIGYASEDFYEVTTDT
ncbi:MAG TPA: DUF4272 domain-containing protein [Candidatus Limnocylindrales bacterium]|nr:DUF4272 domain-containing protein [Candidatus Limnocylindrales bacterium]